MRCKTRFSKKNNTIIPSLASYYSHYITIATTLTLKDNINFIIIIALASIPLDQTITATLTS